ncbi:MAG: flagellar motor switch protein FliG [Planctomycetales bacterium]|nr:flagellar motor switch protein FliG [Planctomycetales bacterium]
MADASNLRKAAVLLMSMSEDDAAALIAKLSPKQIEAVSIEIAKLGSVPPDEQAKTIRDFMQANPKSLTARIGGLSLAQALVDRALGDKAKDTINSVRQSVEALPFGFLKKVDPQNIQSYIIDEHPQTIALILSYLPPAYGAEIVSNLPPEKQISVIRRVAKMGQTSPEVISEVERGLEHRMANVMHQSFDMAGGVGNVAEILNVTDRATERALLDSLAEEDPELVDEIRRLMFVFEDINKLGDKDIQQVLKNVESNQWAMALKGASEQLRDKILGNMSSRAAQMLSEEMEFLGGVKRSEVESVQQQIVDIIRQMEDAGQISTAGGEEAEELVS